MIQLDGTASEKLYSKDTTGTTTSCPVHAWTCPYFVEFNIVHKSNGTEQWCPVKRSGCILDQVVSFNRSCTVYTPSAVHVRSYCITVTVVAFL